MTKEEKQFMQDNILNYETIKSGYVRNLDLPILQMYEHIYRKYLDANFVLTKWCSDCVYTTLKRLYEYYINLPIDTPTIEEQIAILEYEDFKKEMKKRGRPKK
jgi:hypothetical protein